jgi:hypothetical protein
LKFGLGDEAPGLATSSLSRRRLEFGLGVEAPERTPPEPRLRLDAGVDDDEDAGERPPESDPPTDRIDLVSRVFPLKNLIAMASRSAREGHGAIAKAPPECLPQALARPPSPSPACARNGY